MITEEAIEKAALKLADEYYAEYSGMVYTGFKEGVKWALRQVQSEYFAKNN